MLDKIKNLFKEGLEYTHTAGLLQQISNLTNIVHVQYMKSGEAKNEAIDHICAILQSHKDIIPPVTAYITQEEQVAALSCQSESCQSGAPTTCSECENASA